MKKIKYFLEYCLILGISFFIWIFPRKWALKLGGILGVLMSFVLHKRTKLMLDNLSSCFPGKTELEKLDISKKVWRNLGRTAAEFVRITEINKNNMSEFVDVQGWENVEESMAQEKGLILLTGHFSNWEVSGAVSQFTLGNVTAIARPIKNPFVEKWVQRKRGASGMKVILHRQAVRESLRCLKSKSTIGILFDQNLYTGGIFADFFGRPAATTTLPALLAVRTGAPIIISYTLRQGDRFRYIFSPITQFPKVHDDVEKVVVYTKFLNNELEKIVSLYPENWFWIHNRWKRKQVSTN
ncbi:MAG: lysophospholipid acyltransferase family protein [Elusimicrobiota bacterium]